MDNERIRCARIHTGRNHGRCGSPRPDQVAGQTAHAVAGLSWAAMTTCRIALANLRYPASPDASVELVRRAIAEASAAGADLVCFPEAYVPGYRGLGHVPPPPDRDFLERAW